MTSTYEYHPPVTYAGSNTSFHALHAGLLLPVELVEKKTFLLPSLNYDFLRPSTAGTASQRNLHTLTLNAMLGQRFGERWLGVVGGGFGLASDLASGLSGSDLYFTASAIVLYQLLPELSLGAGVSYDRRTGKFLPIPLAAIYWEPIRNFAVRGAAPANLIVAWRPRKMVTLELAGSLDGQRYHLSDDEYGSQRASLAYSLVKLGAGARVHFGELAHLEVLGGALVARRFELFLDGHSQGHAFLPPGPYLSASVWFGGSGWKNHFDTDPRPPVEPLR